MTEKTKIGETFELDAGLDDGTTYTVIALTEPVLDPTETEYESWMMTCRRVDAPADEIPLEVVALDPAGPWVIPGYC